MMISGSIVALVTPMKIDNSIDWQSLRQLIDWHIKEGTDAIVSVGTTGESATLEEAEHCEVIRRTVKYVAGRIPVIAGTGANATNEAIRLTRCAANAGADAVLLVTPYYNKPNQEGLYLHYKAIAESVDIPQILYNVPGRTAVDLHPETIIRLSSIPNIIGLKEAAIDGPERVINLRDNCGTNFALYSGNDDTACQFTLNGGTGVISVTANVALQSMHKMIQAALSGKRDDAQAINKKLAILHNYLFIDSSPIPVKWALARMGLIKKGIRLPLTWLAIEHRLLVESALQQAGLLK